jgi:hypothetical protein
MTWFRPFLYLWASPGSLIGLLMSLVAVTTGGHARVVTGVLEAHGGWVTRLLLRGNPWTGSIAAITLGHVVLGTDEATLERTRRHERVHVRQYERWGPLFIPVYLLASIYVGLRGFHAYLDNPFEVEAYAVDDPRTNQRSAGGD